MKLRRVEQTEQAPEGVVTGNPVRQAQEQAEVFFFSAAEQGHIGAVLGSAEYSAQGNEENLVQVVANTAVRLQVE